MHHFFVNTQHKASTSAFINEIKGLLSEYTLKIFLEEKLKLDKTPISIICENKIQQYQKFLLSFDLPLLVFFSQSASYWWDVLKEKLPKEKDIQWLKIYWQQEKNFFEKEEDIKWPSEGDLILKGVLRNNSNFNDEVNNKNQVLKQGQIKFFPLSLKIMSSHAFVNTKSGGVLSFVKKYFSRFPSSIDDQLAMKMHLEELFLLFHLKSLQEKSDSLESLNMGELRPSELESDHRISLLKIYHEINNFLYKLMQRYYSENETLFFDCLYPLMGHSSLNIIQLVGLIERKKEDVFFKKIACYVREDFGKSGQITFLKKEHFFYINVNNFRLQIRPKPMRYGTLQGLKINCALDLLQNA